jgi:hypothetical protein
VVLLIKSFGRVQSSDRVLNLIQDNLSKAIDNLNMVPLNGGVLVEGISLAIGDNTVYTQLNGPLTGWIIVDIDGVAEIYNNSSSTTPTGQLILNSDAEVTVSLFVF